MICVSPITNLKNSNFSTNKINNNKQNRLNSVPADSVSFGNAISKPQQLADAFEALVGQVRRDAKTVDKDMLGGLVTDMVAFAKQGIQAAEVDFTFFERFPKPTRTVLSNLITSVTRKFEPPAGETVPKLSYVIKSPLRNEKYPQWSYLLTTVCVDDANIAKATAYNPQAPQTIFAKIMQKNDSMLHGDKPWTVTNAGIAIPPKLNLVNFNLHDLGHIEMITLG